MGGAAEQAEPLSVVTKLDIAGQVGATGRHPLWQEYGYHTFLDLTWRLSPRCADRSVPACSTCT